MTCNLVQFLGMIVSGICEITYEYEKNIPVHIAQDMTQKLALLSYEKWEVIIIQSVVYHIFEGLMQNIFQTSSTSAFNTLLRERYFLRHVAHCDSVHYIHKSTACYSLGRLSVRLRRIKLNVCYHA